MKKLSFCFVVALLCTTLFFSNLFWRGDMVFAQNNVNPGDTVFLELPVFTGTIQWQQSTDSITWNDIPDATYQPYFILADTTYFTRAKITDGTCNPVYSDVQKFTVISGFTCGSSFTDARDGKSYNTVLIGSQCWMAENLAYLPSVVGPATGSDTVPYYYVYDYYTDTVVADAKATSYYTTYGVLYNWPAFMNSSASCNGTAPPPDANAKCSPVVQGVCPAGWHVPSHYEWTLLEINVGSNPGAFPYDVVTTGVLGTDEGGNLKQTGTTLWTTPNTGATNTSGFTALPGSYRMSVGAFHLEGDYGYWWSATESGTSAWNRFLYYNNAQVYRYPDSKGSGFSCRCVKD